MTATVVANKPLAGLTPGLSVQLQLQYREEERFNSRLVGYFAPHSILVTTPTLGDGPIRPRLKQKVTVRYFVGTSACAFESAIINICTAPFHYLHLAYPRQIATGGVRRSRRASCKLRSAVINRANPLQGQTNGELSDLSVDGGRLEVELGFAQLGDELALRASMQVGSVQRLFSTVAKVRSITPTASGEAYGLEFIGVTPDDQLLLYAFVHTQLVEQGS